MEEAKELMIQDYAKQTLVLRTYLRTRGFYNALKAMEYGLSYHTNIRKDGQPEFSHQVSQACLFMTIDSNALFTEETYICIFLHDLPEDYQEVSINLIREKFGIVAGDAVGIMCKVHSDIENKLSNGYYYQQISTNPISSISKGLDRVHNLMTMLGAFSPEKQLEYIKETIDVVLPMMKISRNRFPEQHKIYENIKFIITNQIGLYKALNEK